MDRRISRRRAIEGAVLLATLATARSGVAQAPLPTLAMATGSREPLISVPGRPGFVEEVAREAFRRAGLALQVVSLPPERALINANAGIEDGDLYRAAGFEAAYPNLVQVPEPIGEEQFVAFALRPGITVRAAADLAGHAVGHVTGYKILERLLAGHAAVTTVRDNDALLRLLGAGRIDLAVTHRWGGLDAARRTGVAAQVLEPPLARVPMYVYLHRRHEPLVQPLATALAAVRRDGTWQRLHDTLLAPLEPAR